MPSESAESWFDREWLDHLMPSQLFGLQGRVAIVTGAAGGIGRWLSAGLAQAGAAVVVTDRDASSVDAMAHVLCDRGLRAVALGIDLGEDEAPQSIIDFALERFGFVDVLVNNAGINRRVPMLEATRQDFEEIWKLDYQRCYELAQAAARVMVERRKGSIIHISSLNVAVGLEGVSLLGPVKAALSQLAKVMTVEFGHLGVRTNAIAPGFMATPMNATHWEHPTIAPWVLDRTPMCRPGHPAELVGLCLLLASEAGSFISGQTIFVDGGFTAGSRWSCPSGTGFAVYRERYQDGPRPFASE
jgi:NAD(P)-dependent dehydrogenase (short-subunit alcohol dehydrogenase family)